MSSARKILNLGVVFVATTYAVAGCDVFGPGPSEFVIRVDSVGGPTAVSGGAAFQLAFYGPVGPNGCYQFKEFSTLRSPSSIDVTVFGEKVSAVCIQVPIYLEGQLLTIDPPVTDPFTVRVHQPNGDVLTRVIRAE